MSGTCPSRSLKARIPAASYALSIRSYRLSYRLSTRSVSPAGSRPDRGLAVVQRSRGEQAADRDPAVDRVDMQLVAAPADGTALGVALGAGIAALRQVVQHFFEIDVGLPRQSARIARPLLALARASALAFRLGFRRGLPGGPLAALDGGRVAGDAPCQAAVERPREQRLVQASGQFAGGELGAGAREGCLAGHGPGQVPAAQSAQGAIGLQALDRRARSGLVEDGLRRPWR